MGKGTGEEGVVKELVRRRDDGGVAVADARKTDLSHDDVLEFAALSELPAPWRLPADWFATEANDFISASLDEGGQPDLDQAIARQLVQLKGGFLFYGLWYRPAPRMYAVHGELTLEGKDGAEPETRQKVKAYFASEEEAKASVSRLNDAWNERIEDLKGLVEAARSEGLEDETAQLEAKLAKLESTTPPRYWVEPFDVVPSPEQTCPGMDAAGVALSEAISRGDKIAVFCDYDVDGTTSGEVLRRGLAPYGADFFYGYADAQRGFGLTNEFVEQAAKEGCKVLVTLDCGSGQVAQAKLAQQLGMQVIVVDHHAYSADNPADYHLNPKKVDEERPSSLNTGAQLSWKLAAAVQMAREGQIRPEHYQEAMFLAGIGALADMGPQILLENRCFFWHPHQTPVPGFSALAKQFEEDPTWPGTAVLTQAALNLPKRSRLVSTADIGALLAAEDEKAAAKWVKKLMKIYEEAKPVKDQMVAAALEQAGEATVDPETGVTTRAKPEELFATAVLEGFEDYAGYTGPVASSLQRKAKKPTIVFASKGEDEFGKKTYKFRINGDPKIKHAVVGELQKDEAMLEACLVQSYDEAGQIVERTNLGGHAEVTSGACYEENVQKVIDAAQAWAEKKAKTEKGWFPPDYTGQRQVFVADAQVSPERFAKIEEQSKQLGPFTYKDSLLTYDHTAVDIDGNPVDPPKVKNANLRVSVKATLVEIGPDENNDSWVKGKLQIGDIEREVRFPADGACPVDEEAEWVIELGKPGPYYVRIFHRLG